MQNRRIYCDYRDTETTTIKQRMLNDDYLQQVVIQRIDELIVMPEKQLREFLRQMVWVTMDYYRVNIEEIQKHLKEEWKPFAEWKRRKK